MSVRTDERSVETLRRRAERAIDEGRGRRIVEPLLERILKMAPDGHPCRIFAHRHLAELRLEEDPWAAALHLRKVVSANSLDDVSHSLMALAQALLGNYRTAVASYRRALALAPRNPWYHHNLGHLLDVALDDPHAALGHLQVALEHADPPEHEITASVAHCLARVGRIEQARSLAEQALRAAPENRDHRALFDWIERGAGKTTRLRPLHSTPVAQEAQSFELRSAAEVFELLEAQLRADGFTPAQISGARRLCADYCDACASEVKKPAILAAALHYALFLLHRVYATQAELSKRYGVTPKSVSVRYGHIRSAIDLTPGNPRYAPV
jgi:tetratricopeptide (TPR) repeat protein